MTEAVKTMIFVISIGFLIAMLIVLTPFLFLVSKIPIPDYEEHDRSPI